MPARLCCRQEHTHLCNTTATAASSAATAAATAAAATAASPTAVSSTTQAEGGASEQRVHCGGGAEPQSVETEADAAADLVMG